MLRPVDWYKIRTFKGKNVAFIFTVIQYGTLSGLSEDENEGTALLRNVGK
jgi:hypothetical protein